MSSDVPARPGYFAALAATAVTLLATIAGFNFVMDPFAVWRNPLPGVNDYHPWLHSEDVYRLAIAAHRPRTLVVGTSHVIIGIDPDSPAGRAWGRPLVVSDELAHFDFQLRALEAASASGGLRTALVELDPRELGSCQLRMPDAGVTGAMTRVLLWPALGPSLEALAMNLSADAGAPPRAPFQRASGVATPPAVPPGLIRRRVAHQLGLFDEQPWQRCDYRDPTLGTARLAQMGALAKARGFLLIFFLAPAQASKLRSADLVGYWPQYEILKRRLADFASASGLPVWDFSTATLRPAAGVSDADFYDTTHFRPELGERLMTAMRRGGAAQALGVRLDASNVEAVVSADRRAIAEAVASNPVTSTTAARDPQDH